MLAVNKDLLEQIVDVAYAAADKIMDVYGKDDFSVSEKSDSSPLTAADLAAHHCIVSGLQKLGENTPILSEESDEIPYSERKSWDQYWLVDPLDGTKEFIARNPEFTVNIALIEKNRPVLGVVLVPPTGNCYVGGLSLGGWYKSDREAEWSPLKPHSLNTEELSDSERTVTIVASRRHGQSQLTSLLENLENRFGKVEVQNVGSALKICLCADGRADLYPRLAPTSEWDTAAAHAVLEAAGGTIMDPSGNVLKYNTKESLLNPYFYALGDSKFKWLDCFEAVEESK